MRKILFLSLALVIAVTAVLAGALSAPRAEAGGGGD